MKTRFLTFISIFSGLFASGCGSDDTNDSTQPGQNTSDSTLVKECVSISNAATTYTTKEPCAPGYVDIAQVKKTNGPIPVAVEL